MKSTVNSTGWIVTSDSCIGSREMCTRFRRVIDTTFLIRSVTPEVPARGRPCRAAAAPLPRSCLRPFLLPRLRAIIRPALSGARSFRT